MRAHAGFTGVSNASMTRLRHKSVFWRKARYALNSEIRIRDKIPSARAVPLPQPRHPRSKMASLRFGGALALAAAVVVAALLAPAHAAVHPYNNEYFYSVGDAFIFRGGREGLFSSKSEVSVHVARGHRVRRGGRGVRGVRGEGSEAHCGVRRRVRSWGLAVWFVGFVRIVGRIRSLQYR